VPVGHGTVGRHRLAAPTQAPSAHSTGNALGHTMVGGHDFGDATQEPSSQRTGVVSLHKFDPVHLSYADSQAPFLHRTPLAAGHSAGFKLHTWKLFSHEPSAQRRGLSEGQPLLVKQPLSVALHAPLVHLTEASVGHPLPLPETVPLHFVLSSTHAPVFTHLNGKAFEQPTSAVLTAGSRLMHVSMSTTHMPFGQRNARAVGQNEVGLVPSGAAGTPGGAEPMEHMFLVFLHEPSLQRTSSSAHGLRTGHWASDCAHEPSAHGAGAPTGQPVSVPGATGDAEHMSDDDTQRPLRQR